MKNQIKGPNIGRVLSDKLIMSGIGSIEELRSIGSENAFIRIKAIDHSACLSMLYALEGAIKEVRWHNLDRTRKDELKEFFNRLK